MKYEDYKELGSEAAVKVCVCISEVGVVGIHMCRESSPASGYMYNAMRWTGYL